jgi:hypothetical protein
MRLIWCALITWILAEAQMIFGSQEGCLEWFPRVKQQNALFLSLYAKTLSRSHVKRSQRRHTHPANAFSTLSRQLEAWPCTPSLTHRTTTNALSSVISVSSSTSCVPNILLPRAASTYAQLRLGSTRRSKAPLFGCCPSTVVWHDKTITPLDTRDQHKQVIETANSARYLQLKSAHHAICRTPTSSAGRSRP